MSTSDPKPFVDRREAVRLDVLDRLNGQVVSLNLPVTLTNLSAGGFAVESYVPLPLGTRHLLRFTTSTGRRVVIEAQVEHRTGPTTGFSFVQNHKTAADIVTLLAALDLAEAVA